MKRLFYILTSGILLLLYTSAAAQKSLFSTQLNLSMGPSRVLPDDKPKIGFSTSIKEMYLLSGAIYVDAGFCGNLFNSINVLNDSTMKPHSVGFISVPVGIGFFMGDDRTYFLTGIDLLTGVYIAPDLPLPQQRRLTWGYMPEFGFSLKVGRARQRGIGLGMTGKLLILQSPSIKDGLKPQISFVGVGIIMRF